MSTEKFHALGDDGWFDGVEYEPTRGSVLVPKHLLRALNVAIFMSLLWLIIITGWGLDLTLAEEAEVFGLIWFLALADRLRALIMEGVRG